MATRKKFIAYLTYFSLKNVPIKPIKTSSVLDNEPILCQNQDHLKIKFLQLKLIYFNIFSIKNYKPFTIISNI